MNSRPTGAAAAFALATALLSAAGCATTQDSASNKVELMFVQTAEDV